MTSVEGLVGTPGGYTGDGTPRVLRFAQDGAAVVEINAGEYQEETLRGERYFACNQAAQAISVALNTTYTGLCLSNPNGSGYRVVLEQVSYALSVAPAAIAPLLLIGNWSQTDVTHTAAVSPRKALLASANAVDAIAKVDSQATIPTPIYIMPIMGGFTAGALPSATPAVIDLRGGLILEPGSFVAIGALTAVTGFGGFAWREIPIV